MSGFIRLLTVFSLLFSLGAQAQTMQLGLTETTGTDVTQEYQHQLSGSFPVYTEQLAPTTVNFRIQWNEENNLINGVYSDNYYTPGPTAVVNGAVGDQVRKLVVSLPEVSKNIASIDILVPRPGIINESVSVTVTPKDSVGVAAGTYNIVALMSTDTTLLPEPEEAQGNCEQGFGAISGFCGLYGGTITEVSDNANRCHPLIGTRTRLEVATDATLALYLGYTGSIANLPTHELGPLMVAPVSTNFAHVGRACTPLAGTTFDADNCKTLNLEGTFLELAGTRSYTGTYTITDDATGEFCRYNISFEREVAY